MGFLGFGCCCEAATPGSTSSPLPHYSSQLPLLVLTGDHRAPGCLHEPARCGDREPLLGGLAGHSDPGTDHLPRHARSPSGPDSVVQSCLCACQRVGRDCHLVHRGAPSIIDDFLRSAPKVGPDIHVKVGEALYSVPWAYIGRSVDARLGPRTVEVFVDTKLVKTHVRIERGRQTDVADYPPEKVAFFMATPAWCRRQADQLGESVAELVGVLMEVNALYRLRQAQGVIRLADKHGAQRLDAACRRAIIVGDPCLKTVRGILIAGTETDGDERAETPPSAPAHLHGPRRLFEPGAAAEEAS